MKIVPFLSSIFCLAIAVQSAFASDERKPSAALTGVVADAETGEELTGVSISVNGSDSITWSERDGGFFISPDQIPDGDFTVCFSLVSFETLCINVSPEEARQGLVVVLKEK